MDGRGVRWTKVMAAGTFLAIAISGCSGGGDQADPLADPPPVSVPSDPFCDAARDLRDALRAPAAEGAEETADAFEAMAAHAPDDLAFDITTVQGSLAQTREGDNLPTREEALAKLTGPDLDRTYLRVVEGVRAECSVDLDD